MKKKIIISNIFLLTLYLSSSCSTASKPSFHHDTYGTLPVSSPIVDKEMRSCSSMLQKQQPQEITLGATSIIAASVPVIETTEITHGIAKASTILKAAAAAKIIKKAQNDMFSCMQKKGWKTVK